MVPELAETMRRDGGKHIPDVPDVAQDFLCAVQNHKGTGQVIPDDAEPGVVQLEMHHLEEQFLALSGKDEAHFVVTLAAGMLEAE